MNGAWVGALVGLGISIGVIVVATRPRSMSISRRVLDQVHVTGFEWHAPEQRRRLPTHGRLWRLLDLLSSDKSVQQRLAKSGSHFTLEMYRLDQLRWGAIGVAVVVVFGLLRMAVGKPVAPTLWLLLCAAGAVAGVAVRDYRLTRAAKVRVAQIDAELPMFAELLAFTVAAGLAPASAIRRVASKVGGQLANELRTCGDAVAAGKPFAESMQQMAEGIGSPDLQRFVDGIVVATQRGTPIADVLRAQAMDARTSSHRRLMEEAGRREIYALVPVVFLVLPVVVVVAVYPGFMSLVV